MKDFLIESYQREARLLTDLRMLLESERDAIARRDLGFIEKGLLRRRALLEKISALEGERKARIQGATREELALLCSDEGVKRTLSDALSLCQEVLELDLQNFKVIEGQRALLERELAIVKEKQKLLEAYDARLNEARPVFLDKKG